MTAAPDDSLDAVTLEIVRNQLEGIADEMGEVLVRGAYSPNVTERRDCSTALFDAWGRLVAQAEHVPVHLGAMPRAVEAAAAVDPDPGDVVALNDPFAGGTHLPDVTLVSPVAPAGDLLGYVASRAHHADVGGATPGSMPAGAREVHEEGVLVPPVRLVRDGRVREDLLEFLLANVRNPAERRADLRAQLAANDRGVERLGELLADHGDALPTAFDAVRTYSRRRMRARIADLPDGTYEAEDVLEGDGTTEDRGAEGDGTTEDDGSDGDVATDDDDDVRIAATVTVDGETLSVDFAGTADQVPGNVNAPLAVAESAVYFAVRCLTDPEIPPNAGCYEPIEVSAPEGSLLNPTAPAAVAGGNVETSQRVVDVVLAALAGAVPERVPAAGQGTMNNLVVGGPGFTYYETIGGGAGGGPDGPGGSGVQVGMTNTRNTPIEALEAAYPLTVTEYALRDGSGGAGRSPGGDGLIRELLVETEATVSLLTDRRRRGPPGRAGGADGRPGRNLIDGQSAPAKVTRTVPAGTTVRVETPGGGGFGSPDGGSAEGDEDDS